MATDAVAICRMALDLLQAGTLTALTDDTEQARLCNRNFEPVRNAVLRAHPWNCCIKRASLGALSDAPAFGFDRQFQLPADCIRLLTLTGDGVRNGVRIDHVVEGRAILTNEAAPLEVRYVSSSDDLVAFYDPLLAEAIAARLAWVLAYPLTGSRTNAEMMAQMYQAKVREARRVDGLEGSPMTQDESDWITARL